MGTHRSIGERLKRARSPEAKRAVASAWGSNWHDEQDAIVHDLALAINANDWEQAKFLHRQLKAVTDKRFGVLQSVLDAIS